MRASIFGIMLIIVSQLAIGQGKYDANWCFGVKAGINFGDTSHPVNFNTQCNTSLVAASISDSLGNLLFYVAPDTPFSIGSLGNRPVSIFNGNNQVIENGNGMDAGFDLTGAIFLNVPGHPDNFHFFYMRRIDTSVVIDLDNLYFATITKGSNGYSVIKKNQLLLAEPLEWGMSAVKHANGRDWWLVLHRANSFDTINRFYEYLITPDSIEGPFTQDIGSFHRAGLSQYGQMNVSKSGNKLAQALGDQNALDLFDFDRCDGNLSNWIPLVDIDTGGLYDIFSCEFSPDESKLYTNEISGDVAANNVLFQYSLTDSNINNSKKVIWQSPSNSLYGLGRLQRAPDNRIYLSGGATGAPFGNNEYNQYNQHLCVINSPDSAGTACDFQFYSYYLGDSARTYWGLPNMPNYNLGPLNSVWQASAGTNTFVCSNEDTSKAHIGLPRINGVIYSWASAQGIVDTTLPQQTVRPDSSRWYYLTLTDTSIKGSCTSRLDSVFVEVKVCERVGIGEVIGSAIRVYPNPASQQLTVEGDIHQPTIFTLQDVLGRTVLQTILSTPKSQLDISNVTSGVYFYRIEGFTGKVVVNNLR